MIVNGYCTLAELQQWNNATATAATAILERAIEAASRAIDQYCNRHFWQVTATARVFDACDPWTIELGAFGDLVSIDASGLKTDDNNDGTFETTWTTSDYQLTSGPWNLNAAAAPESRPYTHVHAVAGRLFPRRYSNPSRQGLIQITGTWGWPAIPTDVTQACLILASRYYKRKESPDGVSNWGDLGVIRIGRTDPDVMALLGPYRRSAVLVA